MCTVVQVMLIKFGYRLRKQHVEHRRCAARSANAFCMYLENYQENSPRKQCKFIPHSNIR